MTSRPARTSTTLWLFALALMFIGTATTIGAWKDVLTGVVIGLGLGTLGALVLILWYRRNGAVSSRSGAHRL